MLDGQRTGRPNHTQSVEQAQPSARGAPSLSLPKGGGAIRGIGEKFAANPVTGTGAMTVPLATSPGRSGFGPQLSLSYDSGAGNGPFGIGWSLAPRQILLPHNASRSDVRPEQFERRAHLVSAIARGRRWLDDVVSGRVTNVTELCARERCSVRQVNMTISLAFLAPNLVKAAVEGRLPRGIGVERLRDPPTEWSRQFEALGLNPE
jgi:hypothetical protein